MKNINTVYPKDSILLCQPPSAAGIESMQELAAMLDAYMPDLRVYGIALDDRLLDVVAEPHNATPQDTSDRRIRAIETYVKAAGVDCNQTRLIPPKDRPHIMSMYQDFGTAWDVVKHDPRK